MATPDESDADDADSEGKVAWRIIEPHCDAVSIYDGPIKFLQDFAQLPEAARHLFAVWWCDSEICNGGFHQFFSNSTGILAPEAREGFRAIGLAELADVVDVAISRFGEPYPRDRDARHAALEALKRPGNARKEWDPFCELDERYYDTQGRSPFFKRLDDFAKRHTR